MEANGSSSNNESLRLSDVQRRMRLRIVMALVAPPLLAAATLCAEPAGSLPVAGGSPKTIRVFDARYLRALDLRDPRQATEVWDTMQIALPARTRSARSQTGD